jgi:hypothetical protein
VRLSEGLQIQGAVLQRVAVRLRHIANIDLPVTVGMPICDRVPNVLNFVVARVAPRLV